MNFLTELVWVWLQGENMKTEHFWKCNEDALCIKKKTQLRKARREKGWSGLITSPTAAMFLSAEAEVCRSPLLVTMMQMNCNVDEMKCYSPWSAPVRSCRSLGSFHCRPYIPPSDIAPHPAPRRCSRKGRARGEGRIMRERETWYRRKKVCRSTFSHSLKKKVRSLRFFL